MGLKQRLAYFIKVIDYIHDKKIQVEKEESKGSSKIQVEKKNFEGNTTNTRQDSKKNTAVNKHKTYSIYKYNITYNITNSIIHKFVFLRSYYKHTNMTDL